MYGTPLFITVAVIAALVGLVVGYFVLRAMRGSIQLDLPRTAFDLGEEIQGSFTLNTKKTIEGERLLVSLVGDRVSVRRDGEGQSTKDRHEFHRQEIVLEQAKTYAPGTTDTYEFTIATPPAPGSEDLKEIEGASVALKAAETVASVARAFGNNDSYTEWRVEARLDAKGIDLVKKQAVTINDGQSQRSGFGFRVSG